MCGVPCSYTHWKNMKTENEKDFLIKRYSALNQKLKSQQNEMLMKLCNIETIINKKNKQIVRLKNKIKKLNQNGIKRGPHSSI